MGALFNASTKYLDATLSASIDVQTVTVGIACWVRWASGQTHVQAERVMVLQAASTSSKLEIKDVTGPTLGVVRDYSGSGVAANSSTTLADDTWRLMVAWTDTDTGASRDLKFWFHNDAVVTGNFSTSGTANDFTRVRVGQNYDNVNNYSRWKGYLAEVSIWRGKTAVQMAAIRDNLLLYRANGSFPDHQPSEYWPLLSDATDTTGGVDLTNNGTVTFDAGTHPTLTTFGGGGGATGPFGAIMFSHRETPQRQARRLGLPGWRGAADLRRAA